MSKQEATRASIASGADVMLRQGIQFGVSLVLARLLSPSDFGLVALLSLFTSFSLIFVDCGFITAIVSRREIPPNGENTIFWFNLAAALLFAGALVFLAPSIAKFYGREELVALLAVASAQVVASAIGAVPGAILLRDRRFDALLVVGASASIASGVAGIGLALLGFGVWALAAQMITASAVTTCASWAVSGWRPQLEFDIAHLRSQWAFSSNLLLSRLLDLAYRQGFSGVVGKLYGMKELGLYNRGSNVQATVSAILEMVVGRVTLPFFSARAEDPSALRRAVRFTLQAVMAINIPAMIGLAALSDLVVVTLFGESWRSSAPILSVLALSGLLWPIHIVNLQVLIARGDSRTFMKLDVVKGLVGLVSVLVGSIFGIMGLAWSQVAIGAFGALVNALPTKRSLDYGIREQATDILGPLLLGALMGAGITGARGMFNLPPYLELAVLTFAGAVFYFGAGFVFRVQILLEILQMLASFGPPLCRVQTVSARKKKSVRGG